MCEIINSFFFFQAEDGIRYLTVTGVQTCALPISIATQACEDLLLLTAWPTACRAPSAWCWPASNAASAACRPWPMNTAKIGRASCRERVKISVVAVSLKKKYIEGLFKA